MTRLQDRLAVALPCAQKAFNTSTVMSGSSLSHLKRFFFAVLLLSCESIRTGFPAESSPKYSTGYSTGYSTISTSVLPAAFSMFDLRIALACKAQLFCLKHLTTSLRKSGIFE